MTIRVIAIVAKRIFETVTFVFNLLECKLNESSAENLMIIIRCK
jgi:hypothetical protein